MASKGQAAKPGRTIREAKRGLSRQLLNQPEISGVGIGEVAGDERIIVYLAEDTPQARALVPAQVAGYPVAVEVTGPIEARVAEASATYTVEPARD
ncbi:MAG: hypothetical protein U0232_01495 [Thermomicrobiales bacterium]